jgi:hypothetical protein
MFDIDTDVIFWMPPCVKTTLIEEKIVGKKPTQNVS